MIQKIVLRVALNSYITIATFPGVVTQCCIGSEKGTQDSKERARQDDVFECGIEIVLY